MCGIIGITGRAGAVDDILAGLRRLEYRGYDSAGMALINEKSAKIACLKAVGKVEKL